MLTSAKTRACSDSEACSSATIWLVTMFQTAGAAMAAYSCATSDRSCGRSVLLMAPTALTSLNALAYRLLVSAGGGSERNWSACARPKGVTFRHCSWVPPAAGQLGVTCHSPGLNEGGT